MLWGKTESAKQNEENVTGVWQWEEHQNKGVPGPVRGRGDEGRELRRGAGGGGGILPRDGTGGQGPGGFYDASVRQCLRREMGKVIAIRCSVESDGSGMLGKGMSIGESYRLRMSGV
jgi:hypothetical protein